MTKAELVQSIEHLDDDTPILLAGLGEVVAPVFHVIPGSAWIHNTRHTRGKMVLVPEYMMHVNQYLGETPNEDRD